MSVQRFVPSIQGLRGLASLSVIFAHLHDMPKLSGFITDLPAAGIDIIQTFGRGVELFFLISGFLIPSSLWRHRRVDSFCIDRFLRIYPLYLFLHIALFVAAPILGYKMFKGIDFWSYCLLFLSNLVFMPALIGLPDTQQNVWSLRYEWAFYIASVVIFKTWTIGGRSVGLALAVVTSVLVLVYCPIAFYFAIGTFCGLRSDRLWRALDFCAVLGILCLCLTYYCLEYVNPFAGFIPAYIFFTLAVDENSATARLLSTPPLLFVGKISYSLYLVHPFVLFPLQQIGGRLAAAGVSKALLTFSFVCIGLPASLLAATFTYELVEVRMRRRLARPLRQWLLRRDVEQRPFAAS